MRVSALLRICLALLLGYPASVPWGDWQRVSNRPIISPQGDGWEAAGTFNPAVIEHDGKFVLLYRAQDKNGTSRIGYA